jgi:ArsR family transcriptional regulator
MKVIIIDTVEFGKALADETRQKIMALCCCQQLSVNDIVEALDVSQPTVSHHLKVLKNAGLVHAERRGKQVLYTLNQERLAQACCKVTENFAPEHTLEVVKDENS